MALDVEGVVDGGMDGEKLLSRSLRFESLLLSLSTSDRQMRILGAIVVAQPARLMAICTTEFIERCPIRSQAIGDE